MSNEQRINDQFLTANHDSYKEMSIVANEEREEWINSEVIVDAYDDEEQAMGWYYYLNDRLHCPFKARWSTLEASAGEAVDVTGMSPEDSCHKDMFVEVLYREGDLEDVFSARLAEIEPIDAESETEQALADWHYWLNRGYELI